MASSANSNASTGSSGWEPPSVEHLQRLLSQYEITALIGRGGMGAVYKGRQTHLDRDVAIKLLPESLHERDDGSFVERFRLEARAMAKMDHPAIISVHDFGETTEGHLFFVMEFIDGMDLQQYLNASGGKLEPEAAVAITSHVLDALDYAHKHGIVHRDIKPANVLINAEGRVKIADFGLAKQVGGEASGLTMSNVAMGTPDFIAPEALLDSASSDGRADLYAVGVMLYQMLTGRLPRGMFKLPSEGDASIDPRFDDIIAAAMEPNPEERTPAAAAFRHQLDQLQSQPVSHLPSRSAIQRRGGRTQELSPAVKGRLPAQNDSGKAGLWIGLAAGLVLIGGGAWLLMNQPAEQESLLAAEASSEPTPSTDLTSRPGTSLEDGSTPPVASTPKVTPDEPEPDSTDAMLPPSPRPAASSPTTTSASVKPGPTPSAAEQLAGLSGFQTRIANYQKARATQIGDLTDKYRSALAAARQTTVQSGNLADVEAVQQAIERSDKYAATIEGLPQVRIVEPLPNLPALDANAPETLQTLRGIFDQETGKIEVQLAAALDKSLNAFQVSLVQKGDLENARALETYRGQLEIAPPEGTALKTASAITGSSATSPRVELDLMDLKGWSRRGEDDWKLGQNAITSSGRGTGLLFRTLPYDDFELEGEFMADKDGNGGISFGALPPTANQTVLTGFQLQLCGAQMPDKRKTGSLLSLGVKGPVHAVNQSPLADGAWGSFKIRYQQGQIQCWLKGEQIVDAIIPDASKPKLGRVIGLEHYRIGKVGYRNLRIAPLSTPTSSPSPVGASSWIPLFNGADLSGWKALGDASNFTVSEGVLKAQTKKAPSYLVWTGSGSRAATLKNFEIRMKVRAEGKANSGLYFHCDETAYMAGSFIGTGHEIQLATDATSDEQKTGSLYGIQAPFGSLPGQSNWFEMTITVEDERVRCSADGRLLLDYIEREDYAPPAKYPGKGFRAEGGAIAIQANSKQGAWYFESIELRELD